jgi:NADH:ubiquinone oxidoreductase subunit 4 (subunit M)
MSPLPLPILSSLVLAPLVGAVCGVAFPEGRDRLRRGLALAACLTSFGIATTVTLHHFPEGAVRLALVERYHWIPTFGASYELGLDSLSALLVLWVSLMTLVALLSERSAQMDRSSTALVLCSESALLGLFLARDALLLLAFLGAGIASLALLLGRVRPSSLRRFFSIQAMGLVLLFGLAAVLAHLVYVQTGFASGELARWEGLVLFPKFEARSFYVGAAAVAVLAPQLPALLWLGDALGALSVPGRILILGGYSLVGGYLFFRFVLQIVPRGAEAGSFPLLTFALVGLLVVAVAPWPMDEARPPWGRLLVGYQSLVLMGLVSLREAGIAAALVLLGHQAGSLTAITLSTGESPTAKSAARLDRTLFVLSCVLLFAIPSVAGVLSDQYAHSRWLAGVACLGAAALGWRTVRWCRTKRLGGRFKTARRRGALIPVLVYCLWLASTSGRWELRFGELAHGLVSRLSEPPGSKEVDP